MKDGAEQSALKEIEQLRSQLIKSVHTKGYTNSETIQLSQKLDNVLNHYNHIQLDYLHDTSCRKVNSN